mmetsp:Transcript_24380/g.55495  ORF Transcript_24380/g.55495 Transcript_24380/m.55495 type:complete len:544 (-) Transcript_24380:350-1981(-)
MAPGLGEAFLCYLLPYVGLRGGVSRAEQCPRRKMLTYLFNSSTWEGDKEKRPHEESKDEHGRSRQGAATGGRFPWLVRQVRELAIGCSQKWQLAGNHVTTWVSAEYGDELLQLVPEYDPDSEKYQKFDAAVRAILKKLLEDFKSRPSKAKKTRKRKLGDFEIPSRVAPCDPGTVCGDSVRCTTPSIEVTKHTCHGVVSGSKGSEDSPTYVVSNAQWFEVELTLVDHSGALEQPLQVELSVVFEDGTPVPAATQPHLQEVNSTKSPTVTFDHPPMVHGHLVNGTNVRRAELKLGPSISSHKHGQRFRIRVTSSDETLRQQYPGLTVQSEPFTSKTKLDRGKAPHHSLMPPPKAVDEGDGSDSSNPVDEAANIAKTESLSACPGESQGTGGVRGTPLLDQMDRTESAIMPTTELMAGISDLSDNELTLPTVSPPPWDLDLDDWLESVKDSSESVKDSSSIFRSLCQTEPSVQPPRLRSLSNVTPAALAQPQMRSLSNAAARAPRVSLTREELLRHIAAFAIEFAEEEGEEEEEEEEEEEGEGEES